MSYQLSMTEFHALVDERLRSLGLDDVPSSLADTVRSDIEAEVRNAIRWSEGVIVEEAVAS